MKINHRRRDAIAADTRGVALDLVALAKKHRVVPLTIARHALLLANPLYRGQ